MLSTSVRTAHDLVTVTTADAKTGQVVDTLTCTPEHPFRTEGGWVLAGNLAVGTSILTRAGPLVVVSGVAKTHSAAGVWVYNFIVQDDHTYFVGNNDEWVHNGTKCAGLHHFVSRALGSTVPYGSKLLTDLNSADHTAVHDALEVALRAETTLDANGNLVDMFARNGNSGALVRSNFSSLQREIALRSFYNSFNGGQYAQEFADEFSETVKAGHWH